MEILISVALLGALMALTYFRFRDKFSELSDATDTKVSTSFWRIATLVYAVILVILWIAFYR